jgi:hypothetical protein
MLVTGTREDSALGDVRMATTAGRKISDGSGIVVVALRPTGRGGKATETTSQGAATAGIVIVAPNHGEGRVTGSREESIE